MSDKKPATNLEQDMANKTESLGVSLHQRSIGHFTICNPWLMPLLSAFCLAISALCLGAAIGVLSSFPWDDSTVLERFFCLLFTIVFLGYCGIIYLKEAAVILAEPHKLIFVDRGSLILQSVMRNQSIAVEDIKTIALVPQRKEGEMPCVRTKFSDDTLSLDHFKGRDSFMKALKAVQPAIIITTA
jgi:hypothetical protein